MNPTAKPSQFPVSAQSLTSSRRVTTAVRFGADESNDKKDKKPGEKPDLSGFQDLSRALGGLLSKIGNHVPDGVVEAMKRQLEKFDPQQTVSQMGQVLEAAFGPKNAKLIQEALRGNPTPLKEKLDKTEGSIDELIRQLKDQSNPELADAIKKGENQVLQPAMDKLKEYAELTVGLPMFLQMALGAIRGGTQVASKTAANQFENPKLKELAELLGVKTDQLTEAIQSKLEHPMVTMLRKMGLKNEDLAGLSNMLKTVLGTANGNKPPQTPPADSTQTPPPPKGLGELEQALSDLLGALSGRNTQKPAKANPPAPAAPKPPAPPAPPQAAEPPAAPPVKPSKSPTERLQAAGYQQADAIDTLLSYDFNPELTEFKAFAEENGMPASDLFQALLEIAGVSALQAAGDTAALARVKAAGLTPERAGEILDTHVEGLDEAALTESAKTFGLSAEEYKQALKTLAGRTDS